MGSSSDDGLPEGSEMTEVGPLPDDWRLVELGQLMKLRTESVQPENMLAMRYVGLEHFDSGESRLRRWGGAHQVRSSKSRFYRDDILYGKLRPYLDKAAIAECEGVCSTDILVFSAYPDKAAPAYLANLLHTKPFVGHAVATTSGVNHPRTSWSSISRFATPCPPLPEQKAIARVLSAIQKAVETQDKIIGAARELKKSLMRHLFTYGPVPLSEAGHVPLKETAIGLAPAHWTEVTLSEAVQKTEHVDPRRKPAWRFRYIDVSSVCSERLNIETYTEYEGRDAPSRAQKLIQEGDAIFATVRPKLKRVALVPRGLGGHICSTAFCVIRAKPEKSAPRFLFQAVATDDFVTRVSENQRGSSYPAVTDKDVLSQSIALPPLPEQQEIARMLSTVDNKVEAEGKCKAALQALFKTMMHLLMTGKLRVKDLGLA